MKINWNDFLENLMVFLSFALAGVFIITAGWFMGSAGAHSTRVAHEFQIACIEKGGTLVEMDDEKSCVKK